MMTTPELRFLFTEFDLHASASLSRRGHRLLFLLQCCRSGVAVDHALVRRNAGKDQATRGETVEPVEGQHRSPAGCNFEFEHDRPHDWCGGRGGRGVQVVW
ncbi:hypothetical protein RESH_00041 [Rhodopirellula europaea SH398]|uniref:Uncharacterized protein n=1 Tax=Rhodopirellula europaea SH398 TaxID=1263868 RepID=M5SCX7_9BACT|nr:hypothetical protein RESH_00041 [Rhodopirellula europaea SH398]